MRPDERINPLAGVRGAVIAIVISALVILGLWLVSRNAPSAGTDPRLAPTASSAPESSAFETRLIVIAARDPAPPEPTATAQGTEVP